MRLKLLVKDNENQVHEPIVEVSPDSASFLKLAAINGWQLIGAITVRDNT